jgi:hypothetical protein
MAFSQDDIDLALEHAETVKLTASLSSADNKTIDFHVSKEIPDTIKDNDVKELLDIAINYYQRSIFTGEYLAADDDPPTRKSGEPIDDINFYLSYYKTHLKEELKKAFNLNEDFEATAHDDGPIISPFAQVMLDYRKKIMAKQKK